MKESFDKKFEKYAVTFFLIFLMVGSYFLRDSFAWEQLEYTTYSGFTGKEITIGWTESCNDDNCTHPDEYEFKIYHRDMGVDLIKGITPNTQITIILSRVGHYIPKVRAVKNNCKYEDPDDPNSPLVPCYSDWVESIDPMYATVNGVNKAWWIFTWISPPGGGGISIIK